MRELVWVGSSLEDLRDFPEEARREAGFSLRTVQNGAMPPIAQPLHGFGGAGVQELRIREADGTYRVVYTVILPDAVYVLHVFKKKSRKGIETPKFEKDLVRKRLAEAQQISVRRTRR